MRYATGYRRNQRSKPHYEAKPLWRLAVGLWVLLGQLAVSCIVLTVIFTLQFLNPQYYKIIGEYYLQTIAEVAPQQEVTEWLSTPLSWQTLSDWWQQVDAEEIMAVFSPMPVEAMGGEETVFPRNASYQRVLVTAKALSPLPCDAVITSHYGERTHPITEQWDFHTGIDLAASEGTEIRSIYPGQVIETGWSSGYGNYIAVQHGETLKSVYCHCSRILAKEGQKIAAGETIAKVGSTGMSTGPHLHLSVLFKDYYIDPMNLYRV